MSQFSKWGNLGNRLGYLDYTCIFIKDSQLQRFSALAERGGSNGRGGFQGHTWERDFYAKLCKLENSLLASIRND